MDETLFAQLQTLYQKHDNEGLLALLNSTAKQLRTAHDAKIATPLTLQERAYELAQIRLPDDYWRIFKHMYWQHGEVPKEFQLAADRYREEFSKQDGIAGISEQNIWLWDEKTAQPMVVLNRKSKKQYRNKWQQLQQLWRILPALPKVWFYYRKLLRQSFRRSVILTNRIGIALQTERAEYELPLLAELKNIPVLLRFSCHESSTQWQATIDLIKKLHVQKNKISVALLQDREAVLDSDKWHLFLKAIVPKIHDKVEWIEVGHAMNRVKWGIWETKEYSRLVSVAFKYQEQYPKIRFVGPAVIDFEWYRVIDALKAIPKKQKFYALSQHLYVDRRGAPENYQGKFSTLEKSAMLKAIASTSKHVDNRVIISEVNWPLQDTGIWSPIGSPYTTPEWFRDCPGVSEEDYANYLVRYLAITLCSGFIDQVFWWRLSAHGFGLVDDQNQFKKRPAFFALKTFIEQVGNATFIKKLPSTEKIYLLLFQKNDTQIVLGWTCGLAQEITLPEDSPKLMDRDGQIILINERTLMLTQKPVYFLKHNTAYTEWHTCK